MRAATEVSSLGRICALMIRAEGGHLLRSWAPPLVAFSSATALALTVFGGYLAFAARETHPQAQTYQVLAAIASILIVVPCFTLGMAAARLGARRRDSRLAALRLTGATPGQVVGLSLVEVAAQALVGAVVGALAYVLCLPLVALLPFQGSGFTVGELWVGPLLLVGVIGGVVLLGALAALAGLRAVAISPLGVAARQTSPAPKALIVAGAAAVVLAWTQVNTAALGIGAMLVALAVVFSLVNLIGPFVVSVVGRILVRRAGDAASLIAARRILDDPKQVWRCVGGVTVASFVAAGTALLTALSPNTSGMDSTEAQLIDDMALGVGFTLVATFGLAAISAVLTQIAAILDNRELYRNLSLAGTPLSVMDGARRRQVRTPVVVMSVLGAGIALGFLFPITGMVLLTAPKALVQLVALMSLGCGLVMAAVRASKPTLRQAMRI